MDVNRDKLVDFASQYKWALIGVVAALVLGVILLRSFGGSDNADGQQSWEKQKADAVASAQALAEQNNAQAEQAPAPALTPDADTALPDNVRIGISNNEAYTSVAQRRSTLLETTDTIIKTAFTWKNNEAYSEGRKKLIEMGVPAESQFLSVYMPELADVVIDGAHYNTIDTDKLEKKLSSFTGRFADKHIYQYGEQTVVSANVASGGASGSTDQHVIVRITFNADDAITDAYAQEAGHLDNAVRCLPGGCSNKTSRGATLVETKKNGGPANE